MKSTARRPKITVSADVIQGDPFQVLAVGHEPRHVDGTHRVQQVSEVIDDILFLESSPYITGEILHIDGGQIADH